MDRSVFKELDDNDRVKFADIYISNDKIYNDWYKYLSFVESDYKLIRSETIIYYADKVIGILRDSSHKQEKLLSLYNDFVINISENNAMAIMAVVLIKLLNTIDKDASVLDSPYKSIIGALEARQMKNPNYDKFITMYFDKNTLPLNEYPTFELEDPFKNNTSVENIKQKIIEVTKPLEKLFGKDRWAAWESLWEQILTEENLRSLASIKKPNSSKNAWDINESMICNVIGLFNLNYKKGEGKISTKKLSDALLPEKDRRRSISECQAGEIPRENMQIIKRWISELE